MGEKIGRLEDKWSFFSLQGKFLRGPYIRGDHCASGL